MIEFTSIDSCQIGDQQCYYVALDIDRERNGLVPVLNEEGVMVDGVKVEVLGVESYPIPTLRAGMEIGLMVRKL